MSEVFDSDLHDYLNKPDREMSEEEKDSLECDLWKMSGCCTTQMYDDSDLCPACGEHSSVACDGCDIYDVCINENKVKV